MMTSAGDYHKSEIGFADRRAMEQILRFRCFRKGDETAAVLDIDRNDAFLCVGTLSCALAPVAETISPETAWPAEPDATVQ
jgi:hypothetical protein